MKLLQLVVPDPNGSGRRQHLSGQKFPERLAVLGLVVASAAAVASSFLVLHRIARWDGTTWNALGSGLSSWVFAIALSGTDVYAGGAFTNAGGIGVLDLEFVTDPEQARTNFARLPSRALTRARHPSISPILCG